MIVERTVALSAPTLTFPSKSFTITFTFDGQFLTKKSPPLISLITKVFAE